MPRRQRFSWLATFAIAAVVSIACGEPPSKEIAEAEGAISAARAAGADRYAAAAFSNATSSLASANDAVAQGDYRLALNHALESRESAQNAAREAAETRARLRGDVERVLAETSALLAQARERLSRALAARGPRRPALSDIEHGLAQLSDDVQRASTAIRAEDYAAAQSLLDGLGKRISALMAPVDTPPPAQSPRRRR